MPNIYILESSWGAGKHHHHELATLTLGATDEILKMFIENLVNPELPKDDKVRVLKFFFKLAYAHNPSARSHRLIALFRVNSQKTKEHEQGTRITLIAERVYRFREHSLTPGKQLIGIEYKNEHHLVEIIKIQ